MNGLKIRILVRLILFFIVIKLQPIHLLHAQNKIPEKLNIHIDRPFYLTGETIWYKIYNTNYKDHAEHSRIVYINIHDKKGMLLIQQKLVLTKGIANGSMIIPLTFHEDYYYLTCFTKWNLQFETNGLAVKKIAVFNPFNTPNNPSEESPYISKNETEHELENKLFSLELNKKSYSRREEVQLKIISESGLNGNFSVSVHALSDLMEKSINSISKTKYLNQQQAEKEKSLALEGVATDQASGEPISSDIISLYKVGTNQFYKTRSIEGAIHIDLEQNSNASSTFQLFNMNPFQPSIPEFEVTTYGKELVDIDPEDQNLNRNPTINKFLRNAQLNQKIIEIFSSRKTDSLQSKVFTPISLKADKVYDMEKYQQMKTFQEFLKEIVIYAEFKKENNKTTIRLKNTETQRFFMEKPWYLVDGYLTRNEDAVFYIPFKNLVRVELFNTNKSILGQLETVMIRSGLIAIYTNNNFLKNTIEQEKNIFEFEGIAHNQEFSRNIIASNTSSTRDPEFEYLLYWNPNVNCHQIIKFRTSDLMGEYTIYLEGQDENGQLLSVEKKFTVNY